MSGNNIDNIIKIIKSSKDTSNAKKNLLDKKWKIKKSIKLISIIEKKKNISNYQLSEKQVDSILEKHFSKSTWSYMIDMGMIPAQDYHPSTILGLGWRVLKFQHVQKPVILVLGRTRMLILDLDASTVIYGKGRHFWQHPKLPESGPPPQ